MKDKELKPIANTVGADLVSAHKGITLIALVITIIVMLILVGVSVSIAINGGLFSTAKKAVTKTEEAKDSELRFIAMSNAATHNEKWEYEVEGEKIPIPAGFAPTEIEGENSLDEGLVIIDAEGNEFVWIPCTKDAYDKATFESNSDWSSFQTDYTGKTWNDGEEELEGKKIKDKKSDSIDANGGFYVARYESGIPEDATEFYASNDGDAYKLGPEKNTNKYKPVSKKGMPAWNFINQINAKTVSENMYSGMSYLIDSHAWNYICKNILKEKTKKNITDSHDWGNYVNTPKEKYDKLDVLYAVHRGDFQLYASKYCKGAIPAEVITKRAEPDTSTSTLIELSTGASEDFKAYNIYDMAGNVWELTTETSNNFVTIRGGCFNYSGESGPVVFADGSTPADINCAHVGFRVVLYL